jgi:hypothetical protein
MFASRPDTHHTDLASLPQPALNLTSVHPQHHDSDMDPARAAPQLHADFQPYSLDVTGAQDLGALRESGQERLAPAVGA